MARDRHVFRTSGGLTIHRPGLVTPERLSPVHVALVELAEDAMRDGFNNVDHILVGAALRKTDKDVVTRANRKDSRTGVNDHAEKVADKAIEESGFYNGQKNGLLTVAVISTYTEGDNDLPKLPCDGCSLVIAKRAAVSGIDTEIVVSNTLKTLFYVMPISRMFRYRNIPEGEFDFRIES
jgi:cytidine deaminase